MTEVINLREIILGILMEVMEEEEYSHIVLRNVLEKYQFLDKRDRAFISRVSEGTLENLIQLDYIIDQFAAVKTADMKPADPKHPSDVGVPAEIHGQRAGHAQCATKRVKLAQRKGFYNLKGFVNGVLRSIARNLDKVEYPDPENHAQSLSFRYLFHAGVDFEELGSLLMAVETVEKICQAFHQEPKTYVRCNLNRADKETIVDSLKEQRITVNQAPYLDYALEIDRL